MFNMLYKNKSSEARILFAVYQILLPLFSLYFNSKQTECSFTRNMRSDSPNILKVLHKFWYRIKQQISLPMSLGYREQCTKLISQNNNKFDISYIAISHQKTRTKNAKNRDSASTQKNLYISASSSRKKRTYKYKFTGPLK